MNKDNLLYMDSTNLIERFG